MKKILLSILLLFPFTVANADMAAPYTEPYDAVISNPNGVKCSSYDNDEIFVPFDTKIHVTFEDEPVFEDDKDEITVSFEYNNSGKVEKCDGVNIKNIKTLKEEYNIKDTKFKKETVQVRVTKEDGIKLYTGPSQAYKEEGYIIPYDTDIILKSPAFEAEKGSEIAWYYTNINGHSGWINILKKAVGFSIDEDIKNKKTIVPYTYYDNNKVLIPVNSEVKVLYKSDPWSGEYYVEYNNNYLWVDAISVYQKEEKITLESDHKLYKEASRGEINSSEELATIPAGTVVKSNYAFGEYDIHYLITYEGKTGWFLLTYDEYYEYDEEIDETTEPIETTTTTRVKKEKMNIYKRSYLYIGGAVILSLTAITTIVLINKKKKNKEKENNKK